MWELSTGYSSIAMEIAFIKKGIIVSFGCIFFISFLRAISSVASIWSEKVKAGIDNDSVIVLVIALLMPVIFLTLNVHCVSVSSHVALTYPPR